jgi:hypothetical protein
MVLHGAVSRAPRSRRWSRPRRLWRQPLLSQISSTRGPAWGGLRVDVPRGPKRSRGANCLYQEVPSRGTATARVPQARVRLLRLHRSMAGVFEAGQRGAMPYNADTERWNHRNNGSMPTGSRTLPRLMGLRSRHREPFASEAIRTPASCNKPWLDSKTPGDPP